MFLGMLFGKHRDMHNFFTSIILATFLELKTVRSRSPQSHHGLSSAAVDDTSMKFFRQALLSIAVSDPTSISHRSD
ncbi:hypothetical protein COLO4_10141 [Corchorus olitorius]|uniref:Uncharacterized protein n=1 Tax=Corchorus olitorius TaxID=93759 RepID=A0A1R3K9Y5_9ROSI|nr:hypothetical protein COLO4_10141 [Corchorus olitorius]